MTHDNALELAVMRAFGHYQITGRGEIAKQHTPRLFGGTFVAPATIDFKGWYGPTRQPLYVECKATTHTALEFSDKGIRESQLHAIRDAVLRDIHALLVVDFTIEHETYVVNAREIVKFADAPWRRSLSLFWLQAFGELAKESDRHDRKKRATWVLDTSPHPLREAAYLAVVEEKARAGGRIVELFPAERLRKGPSKAQESFRDLMARKPRRDAPDVEQLRWRNEFSEWELERDIREAKRVAVRTKKRGWGAR